LGNKSKPGRAGKSKKYRNLEYKSKFKGDYSLYDEIYPLYDPVPEPVKLQILDLDSIHQ
jgi:hypothetical protein